MAVKVSYSKRISQLPPYLFAEIDRLKNAKQAEGADVIDLGVGDPDLATAPEIIDSLHAAAQKSDNHHYPSSSGMLSFRSEVASWYQRRFGVDLDPQSEVVGLIGSKEGIAHICFAFLDAGDICLVPDPGYPVYAIATMFAGADVHLMPLLAENNFLPDYKAIPAAVLKRAKMIFLNYPNNPTTALADKAFFEQTVAFASEHNIIVCHDAAYTEIAFGDYKPLSFLEVSGAKAVGIEFHSHSKTYNMTGWRVGYAVGNAEVIAGLAKIKSNVDSGVFQAVQEAAITAFHAPESFYKANSLIYEKRRKVMVAGLAELGLEVIPTQATFYVWVRVPSGLTSAQLAGKLLAEAAIVATPGNGFGAAGEGYIRFALTVGEDRLREALARMAAVDLKTA